MTLSKSKSFKITLSVLALISIVSCKKISQEKQSVVLIDYVAFDWFNYEGKDNAFKTISKSDNEYINPILSGFYSDPSICRANGKFYLITSTFTYFPGIPIFESTDLVNWKQIGHVITRKEQGDFSGLRISEGMFAPTIRFHNGTFYVICTNISAGGNFIVTAKDPAGPWSDPTWIPNINGIDPDIFFDDNGKVYITHNGPPPNDISKHDGHRAIYMFEYDLEKKTIVGDSKLIVNGGTNMALKPVWIEAPHIIKKDGYYYLICAQGGTGYNHSEVVFKSKTVFGPYQPYKENPILTQRHLDKNRPNQITTTGHADFIETEKGDWWAVFLGCRPYEIDYYNTGRETFLMPVKWENGWPTIVNGKDVLPITNTKPNLTSTEIVAPTTGNFVSHDDFNTTDLDLKWNFVRTPLEKWYSLDRQNLNIKLRDESVHTKTNFSFIGRRQQHLEFEASTKLTYSITNTQEAVGLVAFQNENHYIFIGKRLNTSGNQEVFVERTALKDNDGKPTIINAIDIDENQNTLFVKIEGKIRYYDFYYKSTKNENWKLLAKNVDAINLSTKEAKGFVGTYLGMYGSKHHFNK